MNAHQNHKYKNKLVHETSPYLLQHAHNPVNWYPWCDEAFSKAKSENKLVLISIGYAACHWCHVMEHESFENEDIAQIMNEEFVCIKVDREERPDVDTIYMDAVQMLTGSGGWPLNCFALSDGRPVYGGTYFPPANWKNVLISLSATYKTETEKVFQAANDITEGISKQHIIQISEQNSLPSLDVMNDGINQWKLSFDKEYGGQNRAPKFPMPVALNFLQEYEYYTNDSEIATHLNTTLTKMALGGIYDQIGGAFARYSVDVEWKVPHFEKMLYDNGQLLSVYSNAYRKTPNALFKRIIKQTIEFMNSEMKSKNGAYYSSFDADSEGVEGKFYVWTEKELNQLLSENEKWAIDYFNLTKEGNWEGANILWVTNRETLKNKRKVSEELLEQELETIHKKLLKVRKQRIYPGLDNKILTSWNALMGIGLLDAYVSIQEKQYLENALELAQFFEKNILEADGKLYRNFTNNSPNINAFCEDYALLIKFYVQLYQLTFNYHYLKIANKITSYLIENFWDQKSGMFYYTHKDAKGLVNRTLDLSDNVMPSSNSTMAHNLLDLSVLLSKKSFYEMSLQMLKNVMQQVQLNLPYYANWATLWQRFLQPQFEVVFCGIYAVNQVLEFQQEYHVNTIIAGSVNETSFIDLTENRYIKNKSLIYVCKNKACNMPVTNVSEALKMLK